MNPDIEARLKAAYAPLEPSPGLGDGLFDAIEDSRISVPPEPRRWPAFALAGVATGIVALFGWAALSVDRVGDFGDGMPGDQPVLSLDAERAADQKAYDTAKAGLAKDHAGEWVVIANGRVEKIGKAMEDVVSVAPDAGHRFVFQAGAEGDREEFASSWYGPRFSGGGLAQALGADWMVSPSSGTTLSKDGKTAGPFGVPPFPRVPVHLAAPARARSSEPPPAMTREVFVGSVGPPLMLMPEDWETLRLARFEVPGTMKVMGLPCRMALVEVSVPELGAKGTLVAACPASPRERLVELARFRDAFWHWGESLQPMVTTGREGKWIVFAADRVVAEGKDAGEALSKAKDLPDGAYHRYVLPLPRPVDALHFDATSFKPEKTVRLNGADVPARANGEAFLVTKAVADRLHLEMAEDVRIVIVVHDGQERIGRGAWAWEGTLSHLGAVPEKSDAPVIVFVVYELDLEPTPADDPKPSRR